MPDKLEKPEAKDAAQGVGFFRKHLETTIYLVVLAFSVVCLLIGLIIHLSGTPRAGYFQQLWQFFFSELAIAGFVSLVIIMTIERFTRARHEDAAKNLMQRINEDLFHAVYQRHIPPEVFEEVEECLLRQNIVRKNYKVFYSLSNITNDLIANPEISDEDRNNHLICEVIAEYELHNISDNSVVAPIELFLEIPIDKNMVQFVKTDEVTVNGEAFEFKDVIFKNDMHVGIKAKTNIPAGGRAKIFVKGQTIKRKTDQEVWASRLPSDGITLTVHAPETIQVHAVSNHSSALSYRAIGGGRTHIWVLDKGIFPFQSIIFWWKAQ